MSTDAQVPRRPGMVGSGRWAGMPKCRAGQGWPEAASSRRSARLKIRIRTLLDLFRNDLVNPRMRRTLPQPALQFR
jgi:hypothetical protein